MAHWSQQIEAAYQLTLPEDVRAWIDDELWRHDLGAEFCGPLEPSQLLSPGREEIWAGFMPPDTLPLIGNDYGDWLCLRVGRDGRVGELVKWSHSGGDWFPMGRTLSEALVFDAATRVIRNRRPEFTDPEPPRERVFGAADWAAARGQLDIEPFWDGRLADNDPATLLQLLADAEVAEAGACQELALLHLDSQLKRRSGPQTARLLEVAWTPDFVRWLFDGELMAEPSRQRLAADWKTAPESLVAQDWEAAERVALQVASQRGDLGWALDIAGWAAERRGDLPAAVAHYLRGLQASIFADDSIRFRTQWFPEGFGKFPAFRLHELAPQLPDGGAELRENDYLRLFWEDDYATLRDRVTEHWHRQAAEHTNAQRPWEAYQCLIAAGWDIGMSELSRYGQLLRQLAAAAQAAGADALAAIAETHLRVF